MTKQRSAPSQEQLIDLTDAVRELSQQVTVLREAIDEIRDDYSWAIRNAAPLPPPVRITSMPLDPAAGDWSARLNRLTPADFPADQDDRAGDTSVSDGEQATRAMSPGKQGELW